MKKTRTFEDMHLSLEGMKELDQYLTRRGGIFYDYHCPILALREPNGDQWSFNDSESFLAHYHPSFGSYYQRGLGYYEVTIINYLDVLNCTVTVAAPHKETIQNIFAIIERHRGPSTTVHSKQGWRVYCRKPVHPRVADHDQKPVA